MRDKSDLYYECHITLDPVSEKRLAELKNASALHGFRVATFVMQKDGEVPNAFTSARDDSYARMVTRMGEFVRLLNALGYKVRRYKIENTILDTNHGGDPLGLLPPVIRGEISNQ